MVTHRNGVFLNQNIHKNAKWCIEKCQATDNRLRNASLENISEWVGPMNYARYIAGNLDKSTSKLTRIHSKLNDLSMAF